MSEPTSFEAHAVLAPRRRRLARLALLLPVVALAAITWAGVSGARTDQATADIRASAAAVPSSTIAPTPALPPGQVIGLRVQGLDEVQTRSLGRDDVVAVSGWYVATAITDCPPFAGIAQPGALPDGGGEADGAAFCIRSGVLYASQPDNQNIGSGSSGHSVVGATIVVGVVVPRQLEMVGADAIEVVVIGRLVKSGGGCLVQIACPGELLIDHVAWSAST